MDLRYAPTSLVFSHSVSYLFVCYGIGLFVITYSYLDSLDSTFPDWVLTPNLVPVSDGSAPHWIIFFSTEPFLSFGWEQHLYESHLFRIFVRPHLALSFIWNGLNSSLETSSYGDYSLDKSLLALFITFTACRTWVIKGCFDTHRLRVTTFINRPFP